MEIKPTKLSPKEYLKQACKDHGLTIKKLLSGSRDSYTLMVREQLVWTYLQDWGLSVGVVSKLLNRDHSNIIKMRNKLKQKLASEVKNDPQKDILSQLPQGCPRQGPKH